MFRLVGGEGYREFREVMKRFLGIYTETTYFCGVISIQTWELINIHKALTGLGLKEHVKIEGVLSKEKTEFHTGIFAYDREDASRIQEYLIALDEELKRLREAIG